MGKDEQLLPPGSPPRNSFRSIYNWQALVRKNTKVIHAKDDDHNTLAKVLTAIDLISYGVGATVGAGIFVTVGIVAKDIAGPGILLSFLFAALACLLSAFCYSEFAANIPVSGSAYTFSYVALGEFVGWFIGWNLTLEYTISASAVARGWGGYVASLFDSFGAHIPGWLVAHKVNSLFNLSALSVVIIIICGVILLFGVKDSARFNLVITILNVCTILFVVVLGAFHVDLNNWDPFLPYGISGAFAGAGTVFFSYIGFDSVSSLAGEVKRPGRDLPVGIVGTLLIATALYIAVSLVVTGIVKYHDLNVDAPLSAAFQDLGLHWASIIIGIGSVTALTATTLCSLLGQPRIFFQMAKDGLLNPQFGVVNPKTQAPVFGTVVTCVAASILAFVLDLHTLADMISIGTLLAFTVVCAGVIVMRLDPEGVNAIKLDKDADEDYLLHRGGKRGVLDSAPVPALLAVFFLASASFSFTYKYSWPVWTYSFPSAVMLVIFLVFQFRRQVNIPTTFKCPLVPLIPLLGVLVNTFLIVQLPLDAVKRVVVWSTVGFIIYFGYGIRHSRLNEDSVSSRAGGDSDSAGDINGD